MGYASDAQRKAVHASRADGGKGAPSKMETPLEKELVGKQENLPQHLKDAIEASPAAMVGALAGGMLGQGQVIDQGQAMSNIPPDPSSIRPQFSAITGDKAQGMFGDQYMRQASVNAPYKFPVNPVNPINKYKD